MLIDDCFLTIAITKGKAAAPCVRPFFLVGLYSLAHDKLSLAFFKSLARGLAIERLNDAERAWIDFHPAAIRGDMAALNGIWAEVDASGRRNEAVASIDVVTDCLRAHGLFMDQMLIQRDRGGHLVRH
jgi:hypothetical protein